MAVAHSAFQISQGSSNLAAGVCARPSLHHGKLQREEITLNGRRSLAEQALKAGKDYPEDLFLRRQ